jgi:hypothetical protein
MGVSTMDENNSKHITRVLGVVKEALMESGYQLPKNRKVRY